MSAPYCAHSDCAAHAIDELFWMAKRLFRPDLAHVALSIALKPDAQVRCRHVPRPGRLTGPMEFVEPCGDGVTLTSISMPDGLAERTVAGYAKKLLES